MTPIRLSHTWSRRLFVGLFLLSLVYIVIYLLQEFSDITIPLSLQIDTFVAAAAGLVAATSVALFILIKKVHSFWPSFIIYLIYTLITAYTLQHTGGINSSFLAIWTLIAFFAAVFGAWGWISILVLIGAFTAGVYLSQALNTYTVVLIIFTSFLPLVAGMFIWREVSGSEDPDVKNVKNLASQLSEVATKSEIVINAIGDGVIAIDGKGTIQLINPAAQAILGWGKQDALMLNYRSILKLADEKNNELDETRDPILQVLNTNQQVRTNKFLAVTQSGKRINVALVISPIGEPGNGAIAVFRDITNERAAEREQAEFISTASHEMRTPVASIEGYLGLALNPNTATIDQKARDFILKAHAAAQHLGRLFQDLLDVTKSEDGRMTSTPRVVEVVGFTQTIVQGLTQKATDKGLELIFEPSRHGGLEKKLMPMYYVNQDNDHIREILDNLIENAIKYTPKGNVVVDVTATDHKVIISVKDSGLGIPPEDLPHLFQKFYRINNADRQSIGGTGLGLYLVRRLAEAMQGRVWVESVFKEGSTFYLELPRIELQEVQHLQEVQAKEDAEAAKNEAALQQAEGFDPNAAPVFGPVAHVNGANGSAVPTQAPAPVAAPVAPQVAPALVQTAPSAAQPAPAQPQAQAAPAPQPAQPAAPASFRAPASPSAAPGQPVLNPATPPVPPVASAAVPTAQTTAKTTSGVRPATSVPRIGSLSREEIAERVRQLEELAKQQHKKSE